MSKEKYLDESPGRMFPEGKEGTILSELISIRVKLHLILHFKQIKLINSNACTPTLLTGCIRRIDDLMPVIIEFMADSESRTA